MKKSQLLTLSVIILVVFIFVAYSVGLKLAAEVFQSLGIGFGAFFAALGGLTTFWDWSEKKQKEIQQLKKYKERYPRRLLKKDFKLIRSSSNSDPVYILDLVTKTKYWIKDQTTRKELGFRPDDVEEIDDETFKTYKEGDEIG